jgi:hypothetical protein
MTKTIPVKPTRLDGIIMKAQADFMVDSFERMQYAKQVYDHQDGATREAIDRMQAQLIRISRRRMWISATLNKKGKTDRILCDLPNDAIWNNALYMAVEILKDLAYMDIRVANFNWPADLCVECGKPLTAKKKRKA